MSNKPNISKSVLINLLFPASSALNLTIFLFLCLLLVGAYADVVVSTSVTLFQDLLTTGLLGAHQDTINGLLVSLMLALVALGFILALFALLLGRIHLGKPKQVHLSFFLYILGGVGSAYAYGGVSLSTMYFALLALCAVGLLQNLRVFPEAPFQEGPLYHLSPQESLVSILLSGSGFLYYLITTQLHPIIVLVSAFTVFSIGMSFYHIFFPPREDPH